MSHHHQTDADKLGELLESFARESEAACHAHLEAGDMRAAAVHQRRAAAARSGLLHVGPDEHHDLDFARRHGELSALAHRQRRVRWSDAKATADDFAVDDHDHED